ncbi:triose-phosphate isomerase [Marinospirillum insulare]|uniref:Triosephosphate isomerase n=1 Tax=Marinospirillum insulare TaxID=217169 RepID=A0ABQ5ZYL3_9GAMM|nr:triose-phosphate isomerase [Marinospirillum insulare]GLR64107.1 triosephosphate isomerase [Marinospirillum insulare]
MRQKLVAGNWKMHASQQMVTSLLEKMLSKQAPSAKLLVFPPYPYLSQAIQILAESNIGVGAQDCSQAEDGAYTGEVSATMLADLGVSHVLLGHSERRQYHSETDASVVEKAKRALAAGIIPVICVGETLAQREAGETNQVVSQQLTPLVKQLSLAQLQKVVVAYEPVWAIGTGLTATPEQAQEVHAFLRSLVAKVDKALAEKMLFLYGGSMKPDNAASLLKMPDIDGGLIGGASLDADQFLAIGKAAE